MPVKRSIKLKTPKKQKAVSVKKQSSSIASLRTPHGLGGIVVILLAVTMILLLITYFTNN